MEYYKLMLYFVFFISFRRLCNSATMASSQQHTQQEQPAFITFLGLDYSDCTSSLDIDFAFDSTSDKYSNIITDNGKFAIAQGTVLGSQAGASIATNGCGQRALCA